MLIRVLAVVLVAIWLLWGAARSLGDGRFVARGDTAVSRARNPGWFWASVVLRLSLAGWLLFALRAWIAPGAGGA